MNRINYVFAKVSKCGTTELADFKSELKDLDPNSQKGRHRLGLAETIVLFSLHLSASLIALRLASIFCPPLQKLNVFFILLNIFFAQVSITTRSSLRCSEINSLEGRLDGGGMDGGGRILVSN